MREAVKIPGLGRVSPKLDPEAQNLLNSIKQIIETREGVRGNDNLDRGVTYRDLIALGLITETQVPKK
jgi:hypothetical protein